jgi:plasmid maintenance system antidote protein VapI
MNLQARYDLEVAKDAKAAEIEKRVKVRPKTEPARISEKASSEKTI